jgi:YbbR domain-containing protein
VTISRAARRLLRSIVHNWPLKVAALVLAMLLYVGLVATQDSTTYPGPVRVDAVNLPPDTVVTNQLKTLDEVKYFAPPDLGRLTAQDFRATVDLSSVPPTGTSTSVRVVVEAIDPRVNILDWVPRSIPVTLDRSQTTTVPVRVNRGTAPPGVDLGPTTYAPGQVSVTGAATAVKRVVAVEVTVSLDSSGINVDREVEGTPIDASGAAVTGVNVSPQTIHVTIPVYTNKQSKTVPVNPVIDGTPAPGFRVASIDVNPLTATLEGNSSQLAALASADTAPIEIGGATRAVRQTVALALPTGVSAVDATSVDVTVQIEAVTETRTFAAGLRLDGGSPTMTYSLSAQSVLMTVYGSTADLDRLGSAALTVGLDVSGLAPGVHQLSVVPTLPSGVSVISLDPQTVTVTILAPSTSGGAGSPSAAPSPS